MSTKWTLSAVILITLSAAYPTWKEQINEFMSVLG